MLIYSSETVRELLQSVDLLTAGIPLSRSRLDSVGCCVSCVMLSLAWQIHVNGFFTFNHRVTSAYLYVCAYITCIENALLKSYSVRYTPPAESRSSVFTLNDTQRTIALPTPNQTAAANDFARFPLPLSFSLSVFPFCSRSLKVRFVVKRITGAFR